MNNCGAGSKFRRRVIHLTSVHSPLDVRIHDKECQSLAEAGYEVLIVGPGNSSDDSRQPRIIGVGVARSRFSRLFLTVPSVLIAALGRRADLYHIHDAELIPVGIFLKAVGKAVVFDCHEHLALDAREKVYLPPFVRPLAFIIARILLAVADRCFDGIVAATAEIALDHRNKNTATVNNFPEWNAHEVERAAPAAFHRRRPLVAYIGGITKNRGIKEMITAVEHVGHSMDVTLVLAGPFMSPELEEEVRSMPGWRFVDYRGVLSRADVADMLSQCVCGLVTLHPTGNYLRSNPIKLYEYMSAGLPVIVSDFPVWRDLLAPLNVARFVDPLDPNQIAHEIAWLLQNRAAAASMGTRGRAAVTCHFNWASERDKLLGLYRTVLARSVVLEQTLSALPSEHQQQESCH